MAGGKRLVITFDQAGGVKIDAQNYTGTKCAEATKVYEQLFTAGKRKADNKPEFYQPEAGTKQKIGVGRM